ncbi:MAG TPA: M36 family metallopeptidase [Thermoanaerobaculia bacterium]
MAVVLLASAIAASPVMGQGNGRWNDRSANIYRAEGVQALTLPSTASPTAIVAQFLGARGRDAATLRSITLVSHGRASQGVAHSRMEQRVNGVAVHGAYVKASINERGELVHLIENLAPAGRVAGASIDERQALAAALGRLYPGLTADLPVSGRKAETTSFARGTFFHADPSATRVAIPMADGSLEEGYLVETWSEEKNLLHETLVSGKGEVLDVETRTNTDSYNVFDLDPVKSVQSLVVGPAPVSVPGTNPSPSGWINTGVVQKTTSIFGNNVHAYLDADGNNRADSGGTTVSSPYNFTSVFSATSLVNTTTNRAVAVHNLFFLNNRIHDILYKAGFVESEFNFQENNFSRGGSGSDSVDAEAHDGSGYNNANFSTPRDGTNPRMQMYVWRHNEVSVAGTSYNPIGTASFGPALTTTGANGPIAVAPAGNTEGCVAFAAGTFTGKLAVIDRGTCDFVVKTKNAQNAGARGVIIANHVTGGDAISGMSGTDTTITIPAAFVGYTHGIAIKAQAGSSGSIRIDPIFRDGDLDSDIVYHEYGHGLTWRMITSMSGPLAGAIGEGMGDVLAIVINNDDAIGEYSERNTAGIRSSRYGTFPRSYGAVNGTNGVHYDGEVYGAIGWNLFKQYEARYGLAPAKDQVLRDMVNGMNYTPARPTYEQMRDGVLQATAGTDRQCMVWTAFAQFGVGQGAKGVANTDGTATITESFTNPMPCPL